MKILLTNYFFDKYGGSQLVTLELAEELRARGHDIVLYSPNIGEQMRHHWPEVTPKKPDFFQFDLIWSHHRIAENHVPRESQRMIFNHMSSYVAHEFPGDAVIESQKAWKIFANSEETKRVIKALGVKKEIELMQNPAPFSFQSFRHSSAEAKYALMVSNHRPRDLCDAVHALDIPVKWIGEGEEFTRVTPDILGGALFVACNGKTVQYALRGGIPVFLYDQFGGPGWLTKENFAKAEWFNFSGRDCRGSEKLKDIADWPGQSPMECPDRFKLEKFLEGLGL